MSAITELVANLNSRADKFAEYNNAATSTLDFQQECLYARQALMNNSYLCGIAQGNQQSLVDAIYNVASIGISLNPSRAHAYLVPRKAGGVMKVCLDIGYRGLLKLATDTGVVKYMKAELVYENDSYTYRGFDQRPEISCHPFKERGEIIGVYAMAVLHDDSILVENMSIDQIKAIRDDSEAYKGAIKKGGYTLDNCVWVKHFEEMAKKTVIKRAFKTLPETKEKIIIDNAVGVLNEHEGFEKQEVERIAAFTAEESIAYRAALDNADYTGLISIIDSISIESYIQLQDIHEYANIEKGGKGRYTKAIENNIKVARTLREDNMALIIELIDSDDKAGINEILDECNQFEREWYMSKLNNEQRKMVNE